MQKAKRCKTNLLRLSKDVKSLQQMQKDMPRKKSLETLSFVLPAKTTVGLI